MWTSYREIASASVPENAVRYRGYPVALQLANDPPSVVLRLSNRGVLIGPREDTQLFWIPGQVMVVWLQHGGVEGDLGFPLSNPYVDAEGIHLDFERGVMHTYGDASEIAAIMAGGPVTPIVEHPTGRVDLTTAPGLAKHIIQQVTGTAWWVDDDNVRHWIPDAATWRCLGGTARVALDELHGWEVAVLELGPAATCA